MLSTTIVSVSLTPSNFGTSFPSFHYTAYFSVARVYSGVYDNSWVPYVVAGALLASNIRSHNHWVSDMAAGALIGLPRTTEVTCTSQ